MHHSSYFFYAIPHKYFKTFRVALSLSDLNFFFRKIIDFFNLTYCLGSKKQEKNAEKKIRLFLFPGNYAHDRACSVQRHNAHARAYQDRLSEIVNKTR